MPYKNSTDCGIANFTKEELDGIILLAHQSGMQIAVHCIGDGAMEMTLAAIEKAQKAYPREDCRHGLVHVQTPTVPSWSV